MAELAAAFVRGMQSEGVAATAKHFPGHGDTDTDSHLALPVDEERVQDAARVVDRDAAAGVAAGPADKPVIASAAGPSHGSCKHA
mgnify:CR=1 FL=1